MILGIGVDICQNKRVSERIIDRVLSDEEKSRYNTFSNETRRLEFLSGRFAAKEAIIKALSQAGQEVYMRDLVIINTDLERPILKSPIFKNMKIFISISHEREYSVGLAVVEKVD